MIPARRIPTFDEPTRHQSRRYGTVTLFFAPTAASVYTIYPRNQGLQWELYGFDGTIGLYPTCEAAEAAAVVAEATRINMIEVGPCKTVFTS